MKDFIDSIPYGRDNAIAATELAYMWDSNLRTIRATVARLRCQGVIICSNTDKSIGKTGYFRPETREELETFVKIEQARIRSHKAAIAGAVKELKKQL